MQVLQQEAEFDGLQWFGAMKANFAAERRYIENSPAAAAGRTEGSSSTIGQLVGITWMRSLLLGEDGAGAGAAAAAEADNAGQNTRVLLTRIENYSREFGLLEDTLSSARALFSKA